VIGQIRGMSGDVESMGGALDGECRVKYVQVMWLG
jgi:hypothetical protein